MRQNAALARVPPDSPHVPLPCCPKDRVTDMLLPAQEHSAWRGSQPPWAQGGLLLQLPVGVQGLLGVSGRGCKDWAGHGLTPVPLLQYHTLQQALAPGRADRCSQELGPSPVPAPAGHDSPELRWSGAGSREQAWDPRAAPPACHKSALPGMDAFPHCAIVFSLALLSSLRRRGLVYA